MMQWPLLRNLSRILPSFNPFEIIEGEISQLSNCVTPILKKIGSAVSVLYARLQFGHGWLP
jgi:hypothetical protein